MRIMMYSCLSRPNPRSDLPIALPSNMYRMRNIHAPRTNGTIRKRDHVPPSTRNLDIFQQVKQFLKNNQDTPEMAALELRQEEILRQLSELKKQMDRIRDNLQVSHPTPVPTIVTKPKRCTPPTLPEIIINASPTNPPYSLQLVQKLWKDYLFLSIKTYIHSSLTSLPENAKELTKTLEGFTTDSKVPKVDVRLIWKNVGASPELVISNRPICGEVNILRYLSRVSADLLNYETYSNAHEIDAVLDISHNIVKSKTKTERVGLLQALHRSLGKAEWLAGRSQLSIADLAAYSAIKQVTAAGEVNVGLGKWLQRCAAC